ncbi:hypothetical protein NPIL_268701 [Nephila pilipes]|uniref:Uncharacterized protein n=1 Tax=Nephila pilipes TaxID=299642 RepID=A0A8X6NKC8_NEPPI|nr:hypothetical protein NPIL_268701 [Nephila pilipes]
MRIRNDRDTYPMAPHSLTPGPDSSDNNEYNLKSFFPLETSTQRYNHDDVALTTAFRSKIRCNDAPVSMVSVQLTTVWVPISAVTIRKLSKTLTLL